MQASARLKIRERFDVMLSAGGVKGTLGMEGLGCAVGVAFQSRLYIKIGTTYPLKTAQAATFSPHLLRSCSSHPLSTHQEKGDLLARASER